MRSSILLALVELAQSRSITVRKHVVYGSIPAATKFPIHRLNALRLYDCTGRLTSDSQGVFENDPGAVVCKRVAEASFYDILVGELIQIVPYFHHGELGGGDQI